MIEEQPNIPVTPETLVAKVKEMHDAGHRLVHIGTTPLKEIVELNYGFDLAGKYTNLRMQIPSVGSRIPSVSGVYWCAFLYENEIFDLFNIQVDGMALDFKGNFYKMSKPFPFAPAPAAPVEPAVAAAPAPTATPTAAPAAH